MRHKDPVREIVNAAYQGPMLEGMWPDEEDEARAKWLVARIKELESTQQPRPLDDVPEPGTLVNVVVTGSVPLHLGNDHENWGLGGIVGWLPLPDQSEKFPDQINELLPMHSDVPDVWLIRQRDGDKYSWWKEHGRGLVTDAIAAGVHTEADARHAVSGRPTVLKAVRLVDALHGMSCRGTVAELLGWMPDREDFPDNPEIGASGKKP